MSYDFIQHAERIEKNLRLMKFGAAADGLDDARRGGSTSGEILMRLRHECRLAKLDPAIPREIKDDIIALIKAIEEAEV